MRNVYIVGPSGGGKTSLFHYLRAHLDDRFHFPLRVVSRRPRTAADGLENVFLSHDAFEELRRKGDPSMFFSWHRLMEGDRVEYYGYRVCDIDPDKINVFSANNALLLYPDSYIPPNTLTAHPSCFIACIAPADVRRARLKTRSPEFSDAELEVRINQESIEGMLGSLDLVIDTTDITQEETGQRAVEFLSRFST
jgi:guanylate kinase